MIPYGVIRSRLWTVQRRPEVVVTDLANIGPDNYTVLYGIICMYKITSLIRRKKLRPKSSLVVAL